jgi:hypothetical protein
MEKLQSHPETGTGIGSGGLSHGDIRALENDRTWTYALPHVDGHLSSGPDARLQPCRFNRISPNKTLRARPATTRRSPPQALASFEAA